MTDTTLIEKYPWLKYVNSVEDYLPPEYYKDLLQPYTFNGVTDLQLLKNFLKNKNVSSALELGCGSGRASAAAVQMFPGVNYTFSDLSKRMLTSAKSHLPQDASFVVSDAIEFMENTANTFDLVYTLWSFSHSTHQHLHRLGIEDGRKYISRVLEKFVLENIKKDGALFLIHFDSLSDEQSVLMRQWQRVFPTFANIDQQSPSKQITEETLTKLDTNGDIRLNVQHLQGDVIQYESEDVLLETFMNFHLETFFNQSEYLQTVLEDIKMQVATYKQNDGTYAVTPGCYVYSFIKN
jgi:ubiquinone/menaquinone biosynthesis C-methylase UbiE